MKAFHYVLFAIVVCACTFQARAQESCYEQYLREHNMKILTAEDADDSYDELKKTVLAKQMSLGFFQSRNLEHKSIIIPEIIVPHRDLKVELKME